MASRAKLPESMGKVNPIPVTLHPRFLDEEIRPALVTSEGKQKT
jgi:hypothetical protein